MLEKIRYLWKDLIREIRCSFSCCNCRNNKEEDQPMPIIPDDDE